MKIIRICIKFENFNHIYILIDIRKKIFIYKKSQYIIFRDSKEN